MQKPDPRRQDEYLAMVERSRQEEIARNKDLANKQLEFQQQTYAGNADTIRNLPVAYAKGSEEARKQATAGQEAEKSRLDNEQAQRAGERDIKYGDQMADADLGMRQASEEGTRAGTAATRSSTGRSEALLPGELAQQQANISQTGLQSDQLKSDLKTAGIDLNDKLAIQKAQRAQAAISAANIRVKNGEKVDMNELYGNIESQYGRDTLDKAIVLARSASSNDEIMQGQIRNSDPEFAAADAIKNDLRTKASAMSRVNNIVAQYAKNGGRLADNTIAEAQLEEAAQILDKLGRAAEAESLRRGRFKQALAATSGDPATRMGQLEAVAKSLSASLQADALTKIESNKNNKYLHMEEMNTLKNLVQYKTPGSPFSLDPTPVTRRDIPVSFSPETANAMQNAPAPPPPDLYNTPGAIKKAIPPVRK
jgi:hypothetical protein